MGILINFITEGFNSIVDYLICHPIMLCKCAANIKIRIKFMVAKEIPKARNKVLIGNQKLCRALISVPFKIRVLFLIHIIRARKSQWHLTAM